MNFMQFTFLMSFVVTASLFSMEDNMFDLELGKQEKEFLDTGGYAQESPQQVTVNSVILNRLNDQEKKSFSKWIQDLKKLQLLKTSQESQKALNQNNQKTIEKNLKHGKSLKKYSPLNKEETKSILTLIGREDILPKDAVYRPQEIGNIQTGLRIDQLLNPTKVIKKSIKPKQEKNLRNSQYCYDCIFEKVKNKGKELTKEEFLQCKFNCNSSHKAIESTTCGICKKVSPNKNALLSHIKRSHVEKPDGKATNASNVISNSNLNDDVDVKMNEQEGEFFALLNDNSDIAFHNLESFSVTNESLFDLREKEE